MMFATRSCAWAFQPTPPRGGRRTGAPQLPLVVHVSTHAPAWGATTFPHLRFRAHLSFNPRPRVGGDQTPHAFSARRRCFNPRPRVGGDRSARPTSTVARCFNPRPRVGGDRSNSHASANSSCFNPRPRVGGDSRAPAPARPRKRVSTHAPAWGATGLPGSTICRATPFQPTPPRGGRPLT